MASEGDAESSKGGIDANDGGIPRESVCGSKPQVDDIKAEIGW